MELEQGAIQSFVAKLTVTPGLKRSAAFLLTLLSADVCVLHCYTLVCVCMCCAKHPCPFPFRSIIPMAFKASRETHVARNRDGILWATYRYMCGSVPCEWIFTRECARVHTCITWSRNTIRRRCASREALKTIREYNSVPGRRCISIDTKYTSR